MYYLYTILIEYTFLNIQVCVSSGLLDYRNLNILSLASVSLGTLVSFGLPKVKRTIYFHAKEETSDKEEPIEKHPSDNENKIKKAIVILGYNFKTSFTQGSVFRWSLWWALGMCGNYQVRMYFLASIIRYFFDMKMSRQKLGLIIKTVQFLQIDSKYPNHPIIFSKRYFGIPFLILILGWQFHSAPMGVSTKQRFSQ